MTHTLNSSRTRRGSAYAIVLMSVALLVMFGLAAMLMVRVERRTAEMGGEVLQARVRARAAVDLGLHLMDSASSWRSGRGAGEWLSRERLDNGRITLAVRDPGDGDLGDDPFDEVEILGTGEYGGATQKISVRAVASPDAMEILGTTLHASGQITLKSGVRATVDGAPLSTNGTFWVSGQLDGDAEAFLMLGLGSITGSTRILGIPKDMPGKTVVDDYIAEATSIPFVGDLEQVVIAPGVNTYSSKTTSADGIYYINTGGSNLTMRMSRVYSTLIVDAGKGVVRLDDEVLLQASNLEKATLIIRGDARFDHSSNDLDEAGARTNFNPAGAPYRGSDDADQADTYPSRIEGVVYVEGNVVITSACQFVGTLIVDGTVSIEGNTTITYDDAIMNTPPDGFGTAGQMVIVAGSWAREVD